MIWAYDYTLSFVAALVSLDEIDGEQVVGTTLILLATRYGAEMVEISEFIRLLELSPIEIFEVASKEQGLAQLMQAGSLVVGSFQICQMPDEAQGASFVLSLLEAIDLRGSDSAWMELDLRCCLCSRKGFFCEGSSVNQGETLFVISGSDLVERYDVQLVHEYKCSDIHRDDG